MRILHIVPSSQIAGVEVYALRLARLQEATHEPLILAPRGPSAEMYGDADIPLAHTPSGKAGFFSMRDGMRDLSRDAGDFDIVHVHSDAEHCYSARRVFPKAGVVFRCSGNIGLGFWVAARAINRWADRAMAISEMDFASFRRAGVPARRLRLVHNGVPDFQSTSEGRSELARSLGLEPERHFIVATLARLVKLKGLDVLVRAAATVAQDHTNVRFVVGGTGPERAALQAQARDLGVGEFCHFPGLIRNTGDLLGLAHAYAHPARHEPFGLAVSEAMSASLPVVATQVGGIIDQVVHGESGLLVERNDPAALAGALKTLIEAPETRTLMGEAGKRRQAEFFSLAGMAKKIDAIYAEAQAVRLGAT